MMKDIMLYINIYTLIFAILNHLNRLLIKK